ncbi:hypothetical protein OCGS_0066 [Oceaniovalibus guishaninsula JLT2003]|uniref:Uncharacterized protein n=1 Tax=Oceaniovalibus guishaninsula JLT2003 TaxID=1231392 RepID=K2IA42_9RHOB|nr:hypothetical protein [Oceaniovalibus guishaninsula]EKE45840.1 hypothetical protein OCGS_0066 [Oceaniovalibus guishaninsula JLT2003]
MADTDPEKRQETARVTNDPKTGPGSTSDPNQANLTGQPEQPATPVRVKPRPYDTNDPKDGPGTTSDPNQANRT